MSRYGSYESDLYKDLDRYNYFISPGEYILSPTEVQYFSMRSNLTLSRFDS